MAEYGKLLSRIWSDPEFTKLDARAQQVYSLLISYSTRNLAGVLPMTLKRWAGCTADSTVDNVSAALRTLESHRFLVVDWDTEEVLIRTYIRNDEVYKQPNLMQAARRFCGQVESIALRWALFDELTKLPEHKNADKTTETANALVEGVERPPAKPIAEPLPEPFAEGSGVGGYVSREQGAPTPTPSPATPTTPIGEPRKTGADLARTRFGDIASRSAPAHQIARAFSDSLPVPIESGVVAKIGVEVDKCLRDHIPPMAIANGIREWAASDSWSPSQIPMFVTKAAARGNGHGKATRKALDYGDAAEALIAELETTT